MLSAAECLGLWGLTSGKRMGIWRVLGLRRMMNGMIVDRAGDAEMAMTN
jgi:hypothetical protein